MISGLLGFRRTGDSATACAGDPAQLSWRKEKEKAGLGSEETSARGDTLLSITSYQDSRNSPLRNKFLKGEILIVSLSSSYTLRTLTASKVIEKLGFSEANGSFPRCLR